MMYKGTQRILAGLEKVERTHDSRIAKADQVVSKTYNLNKFVSFQNFFKKFLAGK